MSSCWASTRPKASSQSIGSKVPFQAFMTVELHRGFCPQSDLRRGHTPIGAGTPAGSTGTGAPGRHRRRERRALDQAVGAREGRQHRAVLTRRRRRHEAAVGAPGRSPGGNPGGGRWARARCRARPAPPAAPDRGRAGRRSRRARTAPRTPRPRPDCRAGRAAARSWSRPNISGLPGRIAICQKSSSSPCAPSTRAHQIALADRGAAQRHHEVDAGAAAARPRRALSGSSRHDPRDPIGRAAPGRRPSRRAPCCWS